MAGFTWRGGTDRSAGVVLLFTGSSGLREPQAHLGGERPVLAPLTSRLSLGLFALLLMLTTCMRKIRVLHLGTHIHTIHYY